MEHLHTQLSHQLSSENIDEAVELEMQMLEAIFYDELELDRGESGAVSSLSVLLKPSVGGSQEGCYVSMTLVIKLPEDYPRSPPHVSVRAPRGLSEDHIERILQEMRQCAQDHTGTVYLYNLIDLARESLSENNRPSGVCMICLTQFEDDDQFHKTVCHHFFHVACLSGYCEHWQSQLQEEAEDIPGTVRKEKSKLPCPVCRFDLNVTVEEVRCLAQECTHVYGESDKDVVFRPSKELQRQQQQMQKQLGRQRANGGVIDKSVNNTLQVFDLTAITSQATQPAAANGQDGADCAGSTTTTTPPPVAACTGGKQAGSSPGTAVRSTASTAAAPGNRSITCPSGGSSCSANESSDQRQQQQPSGPGRRSVAMKGRGSEGQHRGGGGRSQRGGDRGRGAYHNSAPSQSLHHGRGTASDHPRDNQRQQRKAGGGDDGKDATPANGSARAPRGGRRKPAGGDAAAESGAPGEDDSAAGSTRDSAARHDGRDTRPASSSARAPRGGRRKPNAGGDAEPAEDELASRDSTAERGGNGRAAQGTPRPRQPRPNRPSRGRGGHGATAAADGKRQQHEHVGPNEATADRQPAGNGGAGVGSATPCPRTAPPPGFAARPAGTRASGAATQPTAAADAAAETRKSRRPPPGFS